jgi:hypothetical protein
MQQYEQEPYKGELKVGMRVALISINTHKLVTEGTVYKINVDDVVSITRDDGKEGGGKFKPEYGYTWTIIKNAEYWYDGDHIVHKAIGRITSWKTKLGDINVN